MMAALFALGVMSLQWMVLVAALIAAERLPRNALPGRLAAAVVFLALALGLAIAPASVPGLTIPGSPARDEGDGEDVARAGDARDVARALDGREHEVSR